MSKLISLDNGNTFLTAEDLKQNHIDYLAEKDQWELVVHFMEEGLRERLHGTHVGATPYEFLCAYLAAASDNLVIG